MLVVVGAWALAHHVGRHLSELTELGWQRAAEAVFVQILGWGGERGPNMSQYNGMCGSLRQMMNKSAQL